MKRFYSRFLVSFVAVVAIGSTLAGFQGCATLNDHSAAVALVAQQATLRYIDSARPEERTARAQRVADVAGDIIAVVSSEEISIADLAAVALQKLPSNLTVADRQLAVALIGVLSQELKAKLGDGTLIKPGDVASVKSVLESVRDAARLYVR